MAAKGIHLPWRWDDGTISTTLDVIWGMSANNKSFLCPTEFGHLEDTARPYLESTAERIAADNLVCGGDDVAVRGWVFLRGLRSLCRGARERRRDCGGNPLDLPRSSDNRPSGTDQRFSIREEA